jgi:nicotinic acid mononucleotide adenylyltransferase
MFSRFDLAVAERDGKFELPLGALAGLYAGKIHRLALPAEWARVSATRVRERVRRAEPLGEYVAPEVSAYIAAHKLYLGPDNKT